MNPDWSLRGKKILVTGGAGFIGSNLVIALVEAGAKVTVVDPILPGLGGNPHNLAPVAGRITWVREDLRTEGLLQRTVPGQEVVFHLAGLVSHKLSMEDPSRDLQLNYHTTLALMEALRQWNPRSKVIYTSTRQIYGRPRFTPVTEDHPLVPVDANGIHKLASEQLLNLYHSVYGIPSVNLRLTNTFGPRMDIGSDTLLTVFFGRALRGQELKVFGAGTQRRDLNHVDDVVEALLLAADDDVTGTFNLGHDQPVSLNELAAQISELGKVRWSNISFPAERELIDIGDYYGCYAAFKAKTGWVPRISVANGLISTWDFYKLNGAQYGL